MNNYILRVICAGILCAIAGNLINGKSTPAQLIRLLCGLLMLITVISPLGNLTFQGISDYWSGLTVDASQYTAQGESMAQDSISGIIKPQLEAYILDKASRMGLEIAVEVELDAGNHSLPCGVHITGKLSPYAKEVLSSYITETLGIAKENQQWT